MGLMDIFKKKEPPKKRGAPYSRSYAAAKMNRLTADWSASITSADSSIHYSLRTMRARSRELAINNDYARRFLKKSVANVIGCNGIRLQVRAKDTGGTFDKQANDQIEAAWEEWSKKKNCTVDGRMSWIDTQKLFLETVARDGEILVRKVKGFNNPFGFSLQFIEADHLDENYNAALTGGAYIRMGIEFDKWNRPIAYHLLTHSPYADDCQIRALAV